MLANGLAILAGLHTTAALVHHWVFRDRTLRGCCPALSDNLRLIAKFTMRQIAVDLPQGAAEL